MRRPKVLFSLTLLLPLLAACEGGHINDLDEDETHVLTVDEPEAQAEVGDTVEVRIDENASVGDDWQVTSEPSDSVLVLVDEDVESEGDCDGCGGTKVLTYEVVGEGATSIELHNCYRCDTDGNSSEDPPDPADLAFSVNVR
jgi:hypothetical protein